MKTTFSLIIISALIISLITIGLTTNNSVNSAEAKKKKVISYSIQVKFFHACSCTFPVKVLAFNYVGKVINRINVDIGKLADQQDDGDIFGPTFKVKQIINQHPNEISVCIKNKNADCNNNYHGIDQKNLGKINGAKYSVTFDAAAAGRENSQPDYKQPDHNQPNSDNSDLDVNTGQEQLNVYNEPPVN
jgi:hypothetical protein